MQFQIFKSATSGSTAYQIFGLLKNNRIDNWQFKISSPTPSKNFLLSFLHLERKGSFLYYCLGINLQLHAQAEVKDSTIQYSPVFSSRHKVEKWFQPCDIWSSIRHRQHDTCTWFVTSSRAGHPASRTVCLYYSNSWAGQQFLYMGAKILQI